jgi:hypothetical protein
MKSSQTAMQPRFLASAFAQPGVHHEKNRIDHFRRIGGLAFR